MTLERYERRTSTLLAVGAALSLVASATPVVWPRADDGVVTACRVASAVLWVAFAADLALPAALPAALSGSPARYLRHHVLDVLVPGRRGPGVPAAAPPAAAHGHPAAAPPGRAGPGARAVVVSTTVVVVVAAVAELQAERDAPGASTTSFGDSLWWAVATVTTAGYGDVHPVTVQGRVVATVLMVVGISLVGVMTAAVAAWFVRQDGGAAPAAPLLPDDGGDRSAAAGQD